MIAQRSRTSSDHPNSVLWNGVRKIIMRVVGRESHTLFHTVGISKNASTYRVCREISFSLLCTGQDPNDNRKNYDEH